MVTAIFVISIFLLVFFTLVFFNIKDSSKKINNALLIFYLAVSLWISAGIGGVYVEVKNSTAQNQSVISIKKSRRSPIRSKKNSKDHYYLILWGLVIASGVYVVRRPEWAGMIIDALGAWKGKDIDRSKEMLIQHAISNPEDRDWVENFILNTERKNKSKDRFSEENKDFEEIPPDIIPK